MPLLLAYRCGEGGVVGGERGTARTLRNCNMKHSTQTVFIIVCIVCTRAVKSEAEPNARRNLVKASNLFGLHLLQSFNEKNVIFSPFSMSSVLSMVYLGARGPTAQQLAERLGYKRFNLSPVDILTSYHDIFAELAPPASSSKTSPYILESASAMLVSDELTLNRTYAEALSRAFRAAVEVADFERRPRNVLEEVNTWVNAKTRGKIDKLLEYLPTDTKLLLMNALYFKGVWQTQFDPEFTSQQTFYNYDGSRSSVPAMFVVANFRIAYDPDLKADMIQLPYVGTDGDTVNLFVLLPEDAKSLGHMIRKLTLDRMGEVMRKLTVQEVELTLPKLKLENFLDMKSPLKKLGVSLMWSGSADLSGIGSRKLKVDKVVHRATLELDEKGAQAAAVSGVAIAAKSLRPGREFRVNRPFVFFIGHRKTGAILFLGQVMSVK